MNTIIEYLKANPGMTVGLMAEAALWGDSMGREGNYERVAADVLKVSQAEIDEALRFQSGKQANE